MDSLVNFWVTTKWLPASPGVVPLVPPGTHQDAQLARLGDTSSSSIVKYQPVEQSSRRSQLGLGKECLWSLEGAKVASALLELNRSEH